MIPELHAGDILISPPNMPDPRFKNTVLLLTHDSEDGSFALCVNRPTKHLVSELVPDLDLQLDIPLYWGGPVSSQTVWMLHDRDWSVPNTLEVNEDWSMTSSLAMFHHLADNDRPKRFRIMYGYCSWAADQLQQELQGIRPWKRENSWLVAHGPDPEWLFDVEEDKLWPSAASLCANQAVASWMP